MPLLRPWRVEGKGFDCGSGGFTDDQPATIRASAPEEVRIFLLRMRCWLANQIQNVEGTIRRGGDEQAISRDGDAYDLRIASEAGETDAGLQLPSRSVPS